MKQAYQHLKEGATYYNFIIEQINKLVSKWNQSHIKKTDPKIIGEAFKTIFKYHHWIKIEDIEPAIDLGLMGDLGENKGLNSETIFGWFKEHSKRFRENQIKDHTAYQTEKTFISWEQRRITRDALIDKFMEFYNLYLETKTLPDMNHYIPVFFRWFKKLGYITLTEEQEIKMHEETVKENQDMRSILTSLKTKGKRSSIKLVFIDAFILATENNYPIYDQLKHMEL